jgi:hypothetical protein
MKNQQDKLKTILLQTETELHGAKLSIGRAETKTGEANLLIDRLNKQIADEIAQHQATVVSYAEIVAKYESSKKGSSVVKVVYRDRPPIDLPDGSIFFKDQDGVYRAVLSLTYDYSDFRIRVTGDAIKKELSYKLTQRFKGVLARTTLPDGKSNHYFQLVELDDQNNEVSKLSLEKFEVIDTVITSGVEVSPHMQWFDPHLDLGLHGVYSDGINWCADLGISFMSYGVDRFNLNWRFLRVGFGIIKNEFEMSFSPIQWNIGRLARPMNNLWVFPTVGWNWISSTWITGLGVSVVF